jgi:hypothetical protein
MNTREINAIVDRAYHALYVLNNIKWTAYRDRCFDLACAEERDHRRGKPADVTLPKGASVQAAARMFVVKRIAEALLGIHPLTVKHFLSVQQSAFYAQSIVANYEQECREALAKFDLEQLANLDYVEFVNNGSKVAA